MKNQRCYCADLHVHSLCSGLSSHPGIRAFGSRESYAKPEEIYTAARQRGMDFVTITDHNTLDGSLAIAHLSGTFLSCEFDTWFPEDGVKIHVVAYGLDEQTFAAAQKARASIYDLVACLREAGVAHSCAHPLFDMSAHLAAEHIEKLLLLFNLLEGRNGSRVAVCNEVLCSIAGCLTRETLFDMAERQGIEPWGEEPWRKGLTGGSDDHSGLYVAGAHTVAGGDGTVEGFLAALAARDCEAAGEHGDTRLLAHAIYAGSFGRIRELLRLDEGTPRQRLVGLLNKGFATIGTCESMLAKAVRGVRAFAPGLYRGGDQRGPAWEALLDEEIVKLVESPKGINGVTPRELNRRLFACGRVLADAVIGHHAAALLAPAGDLSWRQRLGSSFGIGMVHFLQLPYLIAWRSQSRDREVQARLGREFGCSYDLPPLLAICTDGLRAAENEARIKALRNAAERQGVAVEVVRVVPEGFAAGGEGEQCFTALAARVDPENGDEFVVPSVVALVDYLDQRAVTAIHSLDTGMVGALGMLAGRWLHIPASVACGCSPLSQLLNRSWLAAMLSALSLRFGDVILVPAGAGVEAVLQSPRHAAVVAVNADHNDPEPYADYSRIVLAAARRQPPRSPRRGDTKRRTAALTAAMLPVSDDVLKPAANGGAIL